MVPGDRTIAFRGQLWMWSGKGAWFFVSLPQEDAERIRFFTGGRRRGFGSLRVKARIGDTTWRTSIFPDTKSGSYLLPVKADVREAERLADGSAVAVTLNLDV
ncbi:MAG: DUF1905 domain-containing protein [Bauldia sp.]